MLHPNGSRGVKGATSSSQPGTPNSPWITSGGGLTTPDQLRKHLTVGGLNVAGEAFGVVWAQNADQPHLPT